MNADVLDLDAIEACAANMAPLVTVSASGSHYRYDLDSIRAIANAVPALIAEVRLLKQTRATDRNRLKHTRKALEKARAREDAVRLIHAAEYDEDAEENICGECGWNWPCDTIQALGGE